MVSRLNQALTRSPSLFQLKIQGHVGQTAHQRSAVHLENLVVQQIRSAQFERGVEFEEGLVDLGIYHPVAVDRPGKLRRPLKNKALNPLVIDIKAPIRQGIGAAAG